MARMAVSKTVDLGSSPGVPANRSVAELVDAPVSKSGARKGVRVRVSPERLLKIPTARIDSYSALGTIA